jgi:hypothetical protein
MNLKFVLTLLFNTVLILSCSGCLVQADEQQYSSSSELEQAQDDDDDDEITIADGLNAPEISLSSYSSLSQSSLPLSSETSFVCIINSPYEVRRYELECSDAEYLEVTVADCCISGDVWQAKVKVWDKTPNIAIAVTPNKANYEGVPARVYNNGGTNKNPKQLIALLECRYKTGINVFPAASLFKTKSDGYCKLKDLGSSIRM